MSDSPTTTQCSLPRSSVRAYAWVIWPIATVLLLSLLSATSEIIEARNVRVQIAILQIRPPSVLNHEPHKEHLETLESVWRDYVVEAASHSLSSLLSVMAILAYLRQIKAIRSLACPDV